MGRIVINCHATAASPLATFSDRTFRPGRLDRPGFLPTVIRWLAALVLATGFAVARADSLLLPARDHVGDYYRDTTCPGLQVVDTATGAIVRQWDTDRCAIAAAFAEGTRAFVLTQSSPEDSVTGFVLLDQDVDSGGTVATMALAKAATDSVVWLRAVSATQALIALSVGTADAPRTRLVRADRIENRWQLRADVVRDGLVSLTDGGDTLALWHGGPAGFTVDLLRVEDLGRVQSLPLPVSLQARIAGVFVHDGAVHVLDIEGDYFHRSFDAATGLARDAGPWPYGFTTQFPFDDSGRLLVVPRSRLPTDGLPTGYQHDLIAVDFGDGSTIQLGHYEGPIDNFGLQFGHADDRTALISIDDYFCWDDPCFAPTPMTYLERRGVQFYSAKAPTRTASPRSLQFLGPTIAPNSLLQTAPSIPSLDSIGLLVLTIVLLGAAGLGPRRPRLASIRTGRRPR